MSTTRCTTCLEQDRLRRIDRFSLYCECRPTMHLVDLDVPDGAFIRHCLLWATIWLGSLGLLGWMLYRGIWGGSPGDAFIAPLAIFIPGILKHGLW